MPSIIDRMSVLRLLDEETSQLVEVLPAKEYDEEHIASAINLPLKELNPASATQLDPNRPVVTYCHDYL
jgi:rhodanese-related sulfurtransferase